MRWRWSWLSAVWLIFFAKVKFACCSARIIGAWTPTLSVSQAIGIARGIEQAVDALRRRGTPRFGQADDGAIRIGHHARARCGE